MEKDLGILFHSAFNDCGRAVVWKYRRGHGYTSQGVINDRGDLLYQAEGLLSSQEKFNFCHGEQQLSTMETVRLCLEYKLVEIFPLSGGFARVCKRSKSDPNRLRYNFIDRQGNLLSSTWFDMAMDFCEGFAVVFYRENSGMVYANYLGADGELLLGHRSFISAFSFSDGLGIVEKISERKYYLINRSGKIMLGPFDKIKPFSEGKAAVMRSGGGLSEWNYIDSELRFISYEWIKCQEAKDFSCGWALLDLRYGEFDYISESGVRLWEGKKSPRMAESFREGFALIQDHKTYNFNFLRDDGSFLFPGGKWLKEAKEFNEGFAPIKKKNKWGFIDYDAGFFFEPDFAEVTPFYNGFAVVKFNDFYRFIDRKSGMMMEEKFDRADIFRNGRSLVTLDGMSNFYTMDGIYLLDSFQDFSTDFEQSAFEKPVYVNIRNSGFWIDWFGEKTGD
jgi:hypothetical protein